MDEIRARPLIARLPGLTAEQLRPLIAAAGGEPAAILTRRALDAPDLPPAARAFLASPDETALDADLAWVRVSGARILLCTDPEYPPLLAQSSGAPASLYVLGSLPALASPQLAMVGSRSPTEAGRATARDFAAYFARCGLTVTSGLALGIDAAGHAGALAACGLTLAVCGTGRRRVYPAEHARDVLPELRISLPKETRTAQRSLPLGDGELDKEYEMLLDALGFEPATIDVLVARTRLGVESVASMLLILELKGRVAALPGGRYGRIP